MVQTLCYSHITDTMQQQAAARIDREIAEMKKEIAEIKAGEKATNKG